MPDKKILKEYKKVDSVTYGERRGGKWHYRARIYGPEGKEYPDSENQKFKEGIFHFSEGSDRADEEKFYVSIHGKGMDVDGNLACIEYIDKEEPGTVNLECGLRGNLPGLERSLFVEEPIRERLGKRIADAVEDDVKRRLDEIPDSVFHRSSISGLIDLLKNGFYERDRLSTSFEHAQACDLFIPVDHQAVSLHFKMPDKVCPIKVNYHTEKIEGLSREEIFAHQGDIMALTAIIEQRELMKRFPGCKCTDITLISSYGYQSKEMEKEKEILLTSCKKAKINPEDVIEIITETDCSKTSIDEVKNALKEAGLSEFLDIVK